MEKVEPEVVVFHNRRKRKNTELTSKKTGKEEVDKKVIENQSWIGLCF
jgi:hypothetical protein